MDVVGFGLPDGGISWTRTANISYANNRWPRFTGTDASNIADGVTGSMYAAELQIKYMFRGYPDADVATGTGSAYGALGNPTFANAGLATGTVGIVDTPDIGVKCGLATGTGLANTLTAEAVGQSAQLSSGTGNANSVGIAVSNVGATGTGTASALVDPIVGATIQLASGSGSAFDIQESIGEVPSTATGTGQAYDATAQTAGGGGGSTNANADIATGTGTAYDLTAEAVGQSAQLASGSGTAFDAGQNISGPIITATGTGTAFDLTTEAVGQSVQLASGSGSAFTSSESILQTTNIATGTGSAFDLNAEAVGQSAGLASGSGAANNSLITLRTNSGLATGTGLAFDLTAEAVGQSAQLASGTGTAFNATASASGNTNANAQVATGTGTDNNASQSILVNPTLANGTGTAFDMTAEAVGQSAQLATGVGAGLALSEIIRQPVGLSSGTGASNAPPPNVGATTILAAGTGLGFNPTTLLSAAPAVGLATGTGSATDLTAESVGQSAQLASGSGTAFTPGTRALQSVGLSTGTGAANNIPVNISEGTGVTALSLNAVNADTATSPDSNALDITGDIEIVARVMLPDWNITNPAAGAGGRVISKLDGANLAAGGGWEITPGANRISFQISNGTILVNTQSNTFSPSPVPYEVLWIKHKWVAATSTVTFEYAKDQLTEPSSWTSLGTAVTTGATSMGANAIPVTIGNMTGLVRPFKGEIFRVIVRNGIAGPVVFDADFSNKVPGTTSFIENSSNAATVTLNGAAAIISAPYGAIRVNGAGTANNARNNVDQPINVISATGTAFPVSGGSAGNATAQLATGTGTAFNASESVLQPTNLATGTGSANNALSNVRPNALIATATGTATDLTAESVGQSAQLASGIGSGLTAPQTINQPVGLSTGTGIAFNITGGASSQGSAQLATGTGVANNATGQVVKIATADIAYGVGMLATWTGTNYINFPGGNVSTNFISVPAGVGSNIDNLGDMAIAIRYDRLTPTQTRPLIWRRQSGVDSNNYPFEFGTAGNNTLYFRWFDSTGVLIQSFGSVSVPSTSQWVGVTHVLNDGAGHNVVTFYHSTDGSSWNLVQTMTNTGTTTRRSNAAQVGIPGSNVGTWGTVGNFYQAKIWNAAAFTGSPILNIDATIDVTDPNANSFIATSGDTVTVTRYSGIGPKLTIVTPTTITDGLRPQVGAIAGIAIGNGSATDLTTETVGQSAQLASGTGLSFAATIRVNQPAGLATATGIAFNAVGGASFQASAQLATGTGLANNAVVNILQAITIARGGTLLTQAELWIDVAQSQISGGNITNIGASGTGLNMLLGSTSGSDTNDPTFLSYSGENYLYHPVNSFSNNVQVPSISAYDIPGDMEIVVRAQVTAFGTVQQLCTRTTLVDPNRSFHFKINSSKNMFFQWFPAGTSASVISVTSNAAGPFVDATTYWFKVTHQVDNGAGGNVVSFYYAADQVAEPSSWTQLGTSVTTAGVTSHPTVTAPFYFGYYDGTNFFDGKIFRTILRNGIAGTAVLDADFTTGIKSGSQVTFTESSSNAATVTINRAASGKKLTAVVRPVMLFGTDDYLGTALDPLGSYANLTGVNGTYISAAVNAAFDITGDIDIVFRMKPLGTLSLSKGFVTKNSAYRVISDSVDASKLQFGMWNGTSWDSLNSTTGAIVKDVTQWYRVTRVQSTGVVTFHSAPDQATEPGSWNVISSGTVDIGTALTVTTTSAIEVGSRDTGLGAFNGIFYRAIIRSGISGTIIGDFDTAGYATGATSFTDQYQKVWSLNGSAQIINANPLNFAANQDATIVLIARTWDTGATYRSYVSKRTAVSASFPNGYELAYNGSGSTLRGIFAVSTPVNTQSFSWTAGQFVLVALQRQGSNLRSYKNSAVSPDAGSAGGDSGSVSVFRIGGRYTSVEAASVADMEFFAVAVWRRSLTLAEIQSVIDYYGTTGGFSANVQPSPLTISGTGSSTNLTAESVGQSAQLAPATGTSLNASLKINQTVGLATGSGAAFNATGAAGITANAQLATGTGSAFSLIAEAVGQSAQNANGNGSANTPRTNVIVNILTATGSGSAINVVQNTAHDVFATINTSFGGWVDSVFATVVKTANINTNWSGITTSVTAQTWTYAEDTVPVMVNGTIILTTVTKLVLAGTKIEPNERPMILTSYSVNKDKKIITGSFEKIY